MPSNTLGFTGQEIVTRVSSYIGNNSQDFLTYLAQTLPLAEFRFCKAHDWRFLHKDGLALAVTNGTREYELNISNIGFNMSAENCETITDPTNGRVLKKIALKDIRRFDPKNIDGTPESQCTHWAGVGDQRIIIYPPNFNAVSLEIDGKVDPGALTTLSNYPTVPFKYQEAFIEYVTAIMLDKENDDRAEQKKMDAGSLIKADIITDLSSIGDIDNPRLRSFREAFVDGVGGSAEKDWLNWLFRW